MYWVQEFFSDIRKRFINKDVKVIYMLGNHEVWLDEYIINNCPAFWNICRIDKQIDLSDFEVHPYNTALRIEKTNIKVQHSPPSYAKTGPYTALKEKVDFSYIWGCTHRIGHASVTGDSGQYYHGWFNGWLGSMDLTPDHSEVFKYKKKHLTWQQGASLLTVINGKEFHNDQFMIHNRRKCLVAGSYYEL